MISEQALPPQFLAVKDDDEKFLWIGEPELIPFLSTGAAFLAIGLVWGWFDWHIISNPSNLNSFTIPFFALHLFPFYGSILNMLRLFLSHKNTFYVVTNKRVMMRGGFWGIDFTAIDYDKIQDVEVNVNPLEQMLGVGTIRFNTGKVNNKGGVITNNFIGIRNPYDVFKMVKTVGVDIKTDWNYPNANRPAKNPGYQTSYEPPGSNDP